MTAAAQSLLRHLRRLATRPLSESPGDACLLERFILRRDEDSFAALVGRHGSMVFGVCRRLLGDAHAAEDCFQATFLVLARRVALKARVARRRRPAQRILAEDLIRPSSRPDPLEALTARELLGALDE